VKRVPKLGHEKWEAVRIYAEDEVLAGIQDAQRKLTAENPDRVVTVGGNCMVSLALFDYLHGKYENVGIVWIYAHPDVSTLNDDYPNAHAMVLGSLLGESHPGLRRRITRMSAGRLQSVRGEAGRRKQDSSTRAWR
jgi:arginase